MKKRTFKIFLVLLCLTAFLGALNVSAGDAPDKYIPQNVHWEGKTACWDKVDGAESYALALFKDGKWLNNFILFENINYYDFEDVLLLNGNYEFKVCSEVGSDYTEYSEKSGIYKVSGLKEYSIKSSSVCSILYEGISISRSTPGTVITVIAEEIEGKRIDHFEISPNADILHYNSPYCVSFKMPENDVEIKAVYVVPKILNRVEITDIDMPQYGKTPDFDVSLSKDAHCHFATTKELMQIRPHNENISQSVIWVKSENYSDNEVMATDDKFLDESCVYYSLIFLYPDFGYVFDENIEITVNGTKDFVAEFDLKSDSMGKILRIKFGRFHVKHVHEFSKEWKSDENGHWHECQCGERSDYEAHGWQWITDREATVSETGLRHQECRVCGRRGNDVTIPVIPDTAETTDVSSDETSDTLPDSNPDVSSDIPGSNPDVSSDGVSETLPDSAADTSSSEVTDMPSDEVTDASSDNAADTSSGAGAATSSGEEKPGGKSSRGTLWIFLGTGAVIVALLAIGIAVYLRHSKKKSGNEINK